MRMVFALGSLCLLAGCGQPDVEACETFIKSELQAPATYRRVAITKVDSALMSMSEFRRRTGIPDLRRDENETLRRYGELREGDRPSLRTLGITFEADNGYGVPVRATRVCAFKLIDGKLPDGAEIESTARDAALKANSKQLIGAGLLPNAPASSDRKYDCCLADM